MLLSPPPSWASLSKALARPSSWMPRFFSRSKEKSSAALSWDWENWALISASPRSPSYELDRAETALLPEEAAAPRATEVA